MIDPFEAARAWIAADPDPQTRAAGQALLDAADEATLRAHFVGRLRFGTAGMRGPIGPGPNAMNRALVRRVSLAFGRYVLDETPEAAQRGIAVGFDGRHGSRAFAADTAAVLSGLGIRAFLYDDVVPTPQLAHAVVFLGCAGGAAISFFSNRLRSSSYCSERAM